LFSLALLLFYFLVNVDNLTLRVLQLSVLVLFWIFFVNSGRIRKLSTFILSIKMFFPFISVQEVYHSKKKGFKAFGLLLIKENQKAKCFYQCYYCSLSYYSFHVFPVQVLIIFPQKTVTYAEYLYSVLRVYHVQFQRCFVCRILLCYTGAYKREQPIQGLSVGQILQFVLWCTSVVRLKKKTYDKTTTKNNELKLLYKK
jgi:hypothetical protein